MPSSGSFVTMNLVELHFGNGYMKIGLLISSLHGYYKPRCGAGRQSGGTIHIANHFFRHIEVLPSSYYQAKNSFQRLLRLGMSKLTA